MPDESYMTAQSPIPEQQDELFSEIERDARRYNKAFTEDEEAAE